MSELLLELFSEEIPASMQQQAAEKLATSIASELNTTNIKFWATPRRIGCLLKEINIATNASVEEVRGPKISAPPQALEGFLKKYNLTEKDLEKTNDYYTAKIHHAAKNPNDFVASTVAKAIASLVWPKSMKWGEHTVTWVRPLKSILCLFNNQVVATSYGEVKSSNKTLGHRFLGGEITITSADDYFTQLRANHVLIDINERKQAILEGIKKVIGSLELINDERLLNEIAGLVEFPYVLLGNIENEFMNLPREVLVIALKHHQRYLMLNDKSGKLAPNFIIVANTIPIDGGKEVVHGNQRVLRARLSDAKFFYEQDLKTHLADLIPKLNKLTYHEKLGSVFHRVEVIKKFAKVIAEYLKADVSKSLRAVELCKADLVSAMVKEFPELQGVMGSYYASAQGEDKDVALAIKEHYKPQGPTDYTPTAQISRVVALAEKFATISMLFGIGIKPTGSKDPFALRRAANGIIRILDKDLEALLKRLESLKLINAEVIEFISGRSLNVN